jgi:hypothetical protein
MKRRQRDEDLNYKSYLNRDLRNIITYHVEEGQCDTCRESDLKAVVESGHLDCLKGRLQMSDGKETFEFSMWDPFEDNEDMTYEEAPAWVAVLSPEDAADINSDIILAELRLLKAVGVSFDSLQGGYTAWSPLHIWAMRHAQPDALDKMELNTDTFDWITSNLPPPSDTHSPASVAASLFNLYFRHLQDEVDDDLKWVTPGHVDYILKLINLLLNNTSAAFTHWPWPFHYDTANRRLSLELNTEGTGASAMSTEECEKCAKMGIQELAGHGHPKCFAVRAWAYQSDILWSEVMLGLEMQPADILHKLRTLKSLGCRFHRIDNLIPLAHWAGRRKHGPLHAYALLVFFKFQKQRNTNSLEELFTFLSDAPACPLDVQSPAQLLVDFISLSASQKAVDYLKEINRLHGRDLDAGGTEGRYFPVPFENVDEQIVIYRKRIY